MVMLCLIRTSSSFIPAHRQVKLSKYIRIKDGPHEFSKYATSTDIAVDLKHTEYTKDPVESSGMHPHEHSPVIFIHGLLGSKRNFAYICTSLSRQLKKRRRIISIDLRNHGDNIHDWRDTMTYHEMAQDVLHFINNMGFDTVTLVGHSMGGKVAKTLALTHPDRISGLVVLDIAPVYYDSTKDVTWNGVHKLITSLNDIQLKHHPSKKDVDVTLRSIIDDPALRAFVLTNLSSDVQWKINMSTIHNQLSILADFPSVSTQYQGDTFFIHGGSSRFIRSVHMESIRQYFPNHMLTTIRGAGHWVHADAPDDTIALLEKYLDR